EHRAERGLDACRDAAQRIRAGPFGAALKVLGLRIEQCLLESRVLGFELGNRSMQLAALRPAVALRLGELGSAGGQNLVVARAIAIDGDALALERISELVDRPYIFRRRDVREVGGLRDR